MNAPCMYEFLAYILKVSLSWRSDGISVVKPRESTPINNVEIRALRQLVI